MTGYTGRPGKPVPRPYAPVKTPGLRASDYERDRAAEVISAAFSEGRLTRDELEHRTGRVMAATYQAELAPVVADLPGGEEFQPALTGRYPGQRPVNALAIASLVCSVFAFCVPGVILGHVARHQIRRRGERGGGLALTGLILGWVQIGFCLALALIITLLVTQS